LTNLILLDAQDENQVFLNELMAIEALGPDIAPFVPRILPFLTNHVTCGNALKALDRAGPGAAAAVPALISCLRARGTDVRCKAAEILMGIGPSANEAVPVLEEVMRDKALGTRVMAAAARWRISGDPQPSLPVILAALRAEDDNSGWVLPQGAFGLHSYGFNSRQTALWFAGELGPPAREALPVLINQMEKGLDWQRVVAARSVWKVEGSPDRSLPVLKALACSPTPQALTYKGKPLDAWFYGTRTNFFLERTRKAAQEAFDSFGMNAFPFLLEKVKTARGNSPAYFRAYRALPPWAQSTIFYPISGDDIRSIALGHIHGLPGISDDQVRTFAECVPGLPDPRLRLQAFEYMLMRHQPHPAFLELCRKLMNDEQPGIQLPAAIYLGQSGLTADPRDPRLFPMLVAALEDKEKRKATLDLRGYYYQQQPPGSGPPASLARFPDPAFVVSPDEPLKGEIETALERLRRYLTRPEKDRLDRARQAARGKSALEFH